MIVITAKRNEKRKERRFFRNFLSESRVFSFVEGRLKRNVERRKKGIRMLPVYFESMVIPRKNPERNIYFFS